MRLFVLAALMLAMSASSASASILGSIYNKGPIGSPFRNTIEDSNAEYIVKNGADATKFEVGDQVVLYLTMERLISPPAFFGAALDSPALGGPGYRLLARGTFTISDIDPTSGGLANFSFLGEIEFVENTAGVEYNFANGIAAANSVFANAANTSVFTIGTKAGTDDFIQALGAPVAFADIPIDDGTAVSVNASFGMSIIAGGGDLGVVSEGAVSNATGAPTYHDYVGTVQTFSVIDDSGSNVIGDDLFDLSTNTRLTSFNAVPEPTSMVVFFGIAACGLGIRRRKVS